MMASAPAYTAYAEQVLMPAMDQGVLAEIQALEAAGDTDNPRYEELLIPHYYEDHTLRMPGTNGRSRWCGASPTSTPRYTCRCRARARWA